MRLECCERGELELCLVMAISIGEAVLGILKVGMCGNAGGNKGSVVSLSSGGNSKSSLLKLSSKLN